MPASSQCDGAKPWNGGALERAEDAALLAGRGRFADDLPVRANTLHAAVLRSPHAHADLLGVEASEALVLEGVFAVLTGGGRTRLVGTISGERQATD